MNYSEGNWQNVNEGSYYCLIEYMKVVLDFSNTYISLHSAYLTPTVAPVLLLTYYRTQIKQRDRRKQVA